jgi:hypothetical protein
MAGQEPQTPGDTHDPEDIRLPVPSPDHHPVPPPPRAVSVEGADVLARTLAAAPFMAASVVGAAAAAAVTGAAMATRLLWPWAGLAGVAVGPAGAILAGVGRPGRVRQLHAL